MRTSLVQRGVLCSYALVLWFAGARAPLAFQQTEPARTVLVAVEFRTVKNGVPVVDLKPQDLILRVDNVERQVLALDVMRLSLDGARLPAPFTTNIGTGRGRDVIFVLDEESFQAGDELRLRDALGQVLRQLTPRDRAGLVSLHASGPTVALTTQRALVQAALPLVRGRANGAESSVDLSCRTRRLLPSFTNLMRGLDGGVMTTVLLFSAALAAPPPTAAVQQGAASACLLLPHDFDEFRAAAARSAAQWYSVHLSDTPAAEQNSRASAGLERLAGEAGGQFVRVSGDAAPLMKSIAADTAGFYVASIALEPASGRPTRRVELQIRREGVTTRVRSELVMPPIETKTVSPRDMMRVATAYRALPLRAAGIASRDTGKSTKVVVLFEPIEPGVSLSSASVGLFDAKGQLVAQWAAEPEDLAKRPVMAGLAAAQGTYRLRVAAVDSIGRSGTVDDELRVELSTSGSVTTSGVVFGAVTPTGFVPRLQFTPADPAAAVYLEVYGATPCAAVSAVLEIAASEQAPPLRRSVTSAAPVEQSDACMLLGEVDLSALAPADYTIRVQLQLKGEVIGRRLYTLRKAGR